MLIKERPRLTAALDGLRTFSNIATGLINDTQADLVRNLKNLEPTVKGLADVGPDLDTGACGGYRSSRSPRTSSTEPSEVTTSTCMSIWT